MKELKQELLKVIVEVGGIDNILNLHLRPFINKYGVTKTQNALDYFIYSNQGKARVRKALANK